MLRFAIQHHPSRAELLPRLKLPQAEVVVDPEPDGIPATWRTYRACLERAPRKGHLVVIQDDVLLADDFEELVAAAVADCPCRVLCLFVSRQARLDVQPIEWAAHVGESFVKLNPLTHFVPTVAIAWPAEIARAVADHADRRRWGHRARRADDAIVKEALVALGLDAWATVPSLVEHPDDVYSLMGGKGGSGRKAIRPHPSLEARVVVYNPSS